MAYARVVRHYLEVGQRIPVIVGARRVEEHQVEAAVDDGLAVKREGRVSGFTLTAAGRTRHAELLAHETGRAEQAATRRSQIGSGERAEKIRTYNYPENRVTDHRVKLTVHNLDRVLEGELDEFTEALQAEERRQALETAAV